MTTEETQSGSPMRVPGSGLKRGISTLMSALVWGFWSLVGISTDTADASDVAVFFVADQEASPATGDAASQLGAAGQDKGRPNRSPASDPTRPTHRGSDDLPPGASNNTRALRREAEIPIPAKVRRYAERIFKRYDTDGDLRLQPHEFSKMRGEPALADLDGDSLVTPDEYARFVADFGRQRSLRLMPFAPEVFVRPQRSVTDQGRIARGQSPSDENGAQDIGAAAATPADEQAAERRNRRFFVAETRLPGGFA